MKKIYQVEQGQSLSSKQVETFNWLKQSNKASYWSSIDLLEKVDTAEEQPNQKNKEKQ